MENAGLFSPKTLAKDGISGLIVFLVALPLCLGIALASGAPLFSGLVAGIVGGILVGAISGSHVSVTGPAAGLTAIVAAQIAALDSFEAFLMAVVIGGVLQIGLGLVQAGALSAFFPSSVIKGLLAAIGVILIFKQIPYLLGQDAGQKFVFSGVPKIFSDIGKIFVGGLHLGSLVVGLVSMGLLILWDQIKILKKSLVPSPLIVVLLGVAMGLLVEKFGGSWVIPDSLKVQVPVSESISGFFGFLKLPKFSSLLKPGVYIAGVTIAVVASLETLLNLEAVDKLDTKQRVSPPSRELLAQGVGNFVSGMLGGLPVTSVIIRGSVNINAGSQTKLSAIWHGILLLVCVMLFPTYLNMIPLSCLAAILLMTGVKLASVKLVKQMWSAGPYQFLPFIITLLSIVLTDLLIGIVIGLVVSVLFILNSNLRHPIRRIVEKHVGGEVLHIELANQVSFLNRAALENVLRCAPCGTHVLLDARRTDYIDPDILTLIHDFKDVTAPAHDVKVSLRGFRDKYQLADEIRFVNYATQELHEQLTPARVLQILKEGNARFSSGRRLDRDLSPQPSPEGAGERPMAVVFSGINPRTPAELIFDLGVGDIFSVRIAGNVVGPSVLGSMEFGCVVGGAKVILVMGHTGSQMVQFSVEQACSTRNAEQLTGCQHLEPILQDIQQSIDPAGCRELAVASVEEKARFVDAVARRSIVHSVQRIVQQSQPIRRLVSEGRVAVVGAIYDVGTGKIEFLLNDAVGLPREAA